MLACMSVTSVLLMAGTEGALGFFGHQPKSRSNKWSCLKRMAENEKGRPHGLSLASTNALSYNCAKRTQHTILH